MQLIEINDKKGIDLFHDAAYAIYVGDAYWVAPLRMEIDNTFDPLKNNSFRNGEAVRWVLTDEEGQLIGRVAAFINHSKNEKQDFPTGGLGFFECIDNQDAANILFDACREWLEVKGAKGMDGSVNFGENMVNWGVLVDGFMQPTYGMPYNKPYYGKLFESYGFKDYFQQFSYHKDLNEPFPERTVKFARFLETRPGYTFEHLDLKNQDKYIKDLVSVLNATWSAYMEDFTPIEESEIAGLFEAAKELIEEEFIWFGYKEGKPIGVVVSLPDFNQLLRHFNGHIGLIQAPKFLYLKKKRTINRFRVLLAGIVPEYQNSGAIAALFLQTLKALENKPHYKEMELSWVGDFNKRMIKIYEQIGGVRKKVHITYRLLFDPEIPFERFTNAGGDSELRKEAIKNQN